MRNLFFITLMLCISSDFLIAQVDLSKYYNSDAFKISATEYNQENDLSIFIEVNPEDVEGFYARGIEKMEGGLYLEAIQDFDEVMALLIDDVADVFYLRGLCYAEIDSLEKAEEDFNKTIETLPVHSQAYTQLGLLSWQKDEIKASKKYFDTAYEIDETDLLPIFYKCNIALFHEKNLTKTKRLLNKVIKNDSTFAGAYFYKAAIKLVEGFNKKALQNFDEAIKYNPEFVGAYLWRGFTYLKYDRIFEAEEDFSTLVKLNPDSEDFWALRSFLRIEMENYHGAVDDMLASIKLQDINDDKYKGGRTSLSEKIDLKNALNYFSSNEFHFSDELIQELETGLCFFLKEEYDMALGEFEQGQLVDSTEAAPFFFAGLIHEYQKDYDKAADLYSKALLRDKDIYDAHKKRGMIYDDKNDFRRAYVDFSHMIRLRPDSKLGYKMRGHLKIKHGDYIGATLEFKEGIKRDSSDYDLFYNRALALEQLKNFKAAILDFDVVLNHRNNDSEALYHKALCSFQLGDTIGSAVLCDSSLSISSYNAFAHNLKGQIKSALGKHHEAIFSYSKAISMNSGQIQFKYNRAIAHMVVKNWNPALLDLDKTIAAAPKFGEAYYKRALCYFELDKKEEALIDLKEAEKLGYKPASEELSRNLAL